MRLTFGGAVHGTANGLHFRLNIALLLALVLASFVVAPFAVVPATAQDESEQSVPFAFSTLDTVRARGYIICGASRPIPGFAQMNAEGLWSGFDVDICRAVAAAVFGDPSRVEFRPLSGESRFAHLALGDVDLVVRNAPWTMMRDTAFDATYVANSFYDGQAFMVRDSVGAVSAYELDNITVCVASTGDSLRRVQSFFFEGQVNYQEVIYEDREDLAVAYRIGLCEALSAPASWLHGIRRTLPEPSTHRILPERLSKEPYGPVVRSDDQQWKVIVRWTLFAIINAEELGVTSVNIESMLSARTPAIRRLLGVDFDAGSGLGLEATWMRDVIRGVGNYGEIYERYFGASSGVPMARGQNALWTNGGMLFAPPVK